MGLLVLALVLALRRTLASGWMHSSSCGGRDTGGDLPEIVTSRLLLLPAVRRGGVVLLEREKESKETNVASNFWLFFKFVSLSYFFLFVSFLFASFLFVSCFFFSFFCTFFRFWVRAEEEEEEVASGEEEEEGSFASSQASSQKAKASSARDGGGGRLPSDGGGRSAGGEGGRRGGRGRGGGRGRS